MIKNIVGNLLESDKCSVIVHQANLYHTFGAGIAAAIRMRFPEAYEADCKTVKGDLSRLGTYSAAKITRVTGGPVTSILYVVNLYSQNGIGGKDRLTSYDAMVQGLTTIKDKLERSAKQQTIGIPFLMGCGLANGDWRIVRAIIESVFGQSKVDVLIYTLPELVEQNPELKDE